MVNENHAQFGYISVEEEALAAHLKPCYSGEDASFIQTTQILQALIQETEFQLFSIQILGCILRDIKFERVKQNGGYGYLVKEK